MKCNEPIKAGSLGHGTAVPGHYDLDIVVYSEGKQKKRCMVTEAYSLFNSFNFKPHFLI